MKDYRFIVHGQVTMEVRAFTEKAAREAFDLVLGDLQPEHRWLRAAGAKTGCEDVTVEIEMRDATLVDEDGRSLPSIHNCQHRETGGGVCLDCGHDTDLDEEQ